ncbi:hypothetical protein OHA98_11055 [Streptomyces sp. NBC_00654]|uniref:hypothetical protein n=1 Tax=Streptomyces sp. NBC_00654 TaxID=2975799 RepID=UPI00224DA825|nr:hypothetical protein [Streptomyces sp. NBC_00654]MCX4965362.1 hypothetical protein [Streptomyces sp. NBC_00654]
MKAIKPSVLDEDSRARFLLEVDSLKTVYGPFIASFVAADAHAERPWLAVEYVPGADLLAHVAECGVLPLMESLEVLDEPLEAASVSPPTRRSSSSTAPSSGVSRIPRIACPGCCLFARLTPRRRSPPPAACSPGAWI